LKSCIKIIKPLFRILSCTFKNENISHNNINNALIFFLSNTEGVMCKHIDGIQTKMEILIGMCQDNGNTMIQVYLTFI